MNTQKIAIALAESLAVAAIVLAFISTSYFVAEPQVGLGQATTSGPFTIRTTIIDEISFLVGAVNVTATGSINGITGGTANGSTTVVVRTNDPQGYNMNIAFFNNGTSEAMRGDTSLSSSIRDYPSTSTQPTYTFSTASTSAVFGYTVGSATDQLDIAQSFRNNGTVCNSGGGSANATSSFCWMEPTVSSFQIVNRSTAGAALTGATTTISFRIHVPNNPTPGLVSDTYTATATLTATNN